MLRGFTELHVHSEYSMRDGANKVEKLLDRAKALGHTALAITDHGSMAGIIPAILPWSVIASAVCPSSFALSKSFSTLLAPSLILYSLWTCSSINPLNINALSLL